MERRDAMSTCTFFNFLEVLRPWIDRDYIRKAFLGGDGTFRIYFTDGGEKRYHINDCSRERIQEAAALMAAAGIPVEENG
jgi:hypothetical protein